MSTTQSSNSWRWVGLFILLAILLILWLMGFGPSFSGNQPGCCGVPTATPPVSVQAPVQTPSQTVTAPEPKKLATVNLGLQLENGKVTLTGVVPTDADRHKLFTAATETYGSGNVIDKLTVTDTASLPGWWSKLTSIFDNLKGINNHGLSQSGNVVTLTGVVANDGEKIAKEASLKALLDANVSINNLLTIKASESQPPKEAKVPEAEPTEPPVACSADMNISIHFANNSSYLSAKGKTQLDEVVKCINKPTLVLGHTDNYGESAYNLQLSKARAGAVIAYIKTVDPDKAKLLSAAGYGEKRPIASNANRASRAKNRRIEFVAK
jgi:OmpA-OmpF porin, OOP family